MQAVSADYNPYTSERHVDVEVTFSIVDTQADDAASISGAGAWPTQINQLIGGKSLSKKYGDATRNLVALDGTWEHLPQNVSGLNTGWWSPEISGVDCAFSVPPQLVVEFSVPISVAGFTVYYDNLADLYASEVKITTYNGTTKISEKVFTGNSATGDYRLPSDGINKVVFSFLETPFPQRYIRVAGLVFGLVKTYDRSSVVSVSRIEEISPASETFPSPEYSFTFDNSDHDYNILNPSGLYQFLQDQQPIISSVIINGERVNTGNWLYYKSSAKDAALTASITAVRFAVLLDNVMYSHGSKNGTQTFLAAMQSVQQATGLDYQISIPAAIGSRMVGTAIPENTSCREAARLFAQAAMCCLYFDRDNILRAMDFSLSSPVAELSLDDVESIDGLSLSPSINQVVLTVEDSYSEEDPTTYTASSFTTGESIRPYAVDNPVAINGQAVAAWILSLKRMNLNASYPARGDPALDLGDSILLPTAYGSSAQIGLTKITSNYDGRFSQTLEGLGTVANV